MGYTVQIITVSDRCYQGQREDGSGPALAAYLEQAGYTVLPPVLVPDEQDRIRAALMAAADRDTALILTTGGTGFAPRDVTPEAMRAASMRITPRGMLSRSVAGIRGRSLIVNLPGSPRAALENLEAVLEPIAHGLKMLRDGPQDCAGTFAAEQGRQVRMKL